MGNMTYMGLSKLLCMCQEEEVKVVILDFTRKGLTRETVTFSEFCWWKWELTTCK